MQDSWVDRYYEALEFFYWEPQHLGRQKLSGTKPRLSLCELRDHWGGMEVTLNHLLKLFFSVAPKSVTARLLGVGFGTESTPEFVLSPVSFEKNLPTWNCCQPDFLFLAERQTFCLEMKIDAKSSVEQILKYALLCLAVETKSGQDFGHALVYLGKSSFDALWPRTDLIRTVEDARQKVLSRQELFLRQKAKPVASLEKRFIEIIENLRLGFLNYQDFANVLELERHLNGDTVGNQVYVRMIDGLLSELRTRCGVSTGCSCRDLIV